VLTARSEAEAYVEAATARRDERYRCRQCGAPVTFKPGRVRAAHFAHRPDAACAFGGPMSAAHLAAQNLIAAALRARGLEVELEAPLPGALGDRRIDVLTWPPHRPSARVAIEVQASDLGEAMIEARTASYQAMGVAPLWLRLLDFTTFRTVQTLPFRGTAWIERYRAKAWERWAHDHLGGRLWFMDVGTGHLWRGLFVPAHRFRERALLRGAAGEASARGADWTAASQWVDLDLDGPFALADVKLGQGAAAGPDGRLRRFAWFTPPGEEDARPPFAPSVRVEFRSERIGQSRDLLCHVEGAWIAAVTEGARSDWRTRRPPRRHPLTFL
jgi:Competence protein CoiA-like family